MKNISTEAAILLIGVGNCGRGDDGLGWRFVEMVGKLGYHFIDFEWRYQLQVEDAELISNYDVVIFADASKEELQNGFDVRPCECAHENSYSTHAQSPSAILHLAGTLYDAFPKAYIVVIGGEVWELQTSLSETAEANLDKAVKFFAEQFAPVQPGETTLTW